MKGSRNVKRGLAAAVALLLAAGGVAVAGHGSTSTKVAARPLAPESTTSSTEAPTTSTSSDPTTTAMPTTSAPAAHSSGTSAPHSSAPRTTSPPRPASPPPAPASGITAAFLYNWYPDSFSTPGTKYHPLGAPYSSNDPSWVSHQIDEMRYAGMQAAIASWWGPAGSTSDHAIKSIDTAVGVDLQAAHGTPFQFSLYYESGSPNLPDRSVNGLRNAMQYIKDHYAGDSNFLHVDGRPVIFVWPNADDGCNMAQNWHDANIGFYIVQKRFDGWQSCSGLADSWHEYSPNVPSSVLKPYSYSVSPGFNRYDSGGPYLARNPGQFDQAVAAMAAAPVQWKLVTTFNEWGEGTAVEPAQEWGNTYLDILHNHLGSR
ncbi:MAG: hypothetical protein JO086_06345 [Acidimicrobiia bacterium]|nr:hypothetical protein [Acidimicrobiia bacterium]